MSEEQEATPAEPNAEQAAIETKARALDWTPQDEWKGDPARWTDAETYVKHNEHVLPIVRDKLADERAANDKLRGQMTSMQQTIEGLSRVQEDLADQAYQRAKSEIEARQDLAVENSDGAALRQTREDLEKLDKERPEPAKAPAPQPAEAPEFVEWRRENGWYDSNKTLHDAAEAIAVVVHDQNPNLFGTEFFAEVKRRTQFAYPNEFQNPARTAPAAVESAPSGGNNKTADDEYNSLPAEAKAACERNKKEYKGYTNADFLEQYRTQGGR